MTRYIESSNLALARFSVQNRRVVGVIEVRHNLSDVKPYIVRSFNVGLRKSKKFIVSLPTSEFEVKLTSNGSYRNVRKRLSFTFNIQWMQIDG